MNMLGRGSRNDREPGEASQPLLESHEQDPILCSVDDDYEEEGTALVDPPSRRDHTVRFREDVQVRVFAPPLRSTYDSREAGMFSYDALPTRY